MPMTLPSVTRLRVLVVALAAGVVLALPGVAAAGPLHQPPGQQSGGGGGGNGGKPPGPPPPGQIGPPDAAETPELSSLLLFGVGAVGLGGYALARARHRLSPAR